MNQSLRSPVLCLLGPTAAGKTDFAIELSQKYPFEIVSVDSAQVYRQMDIGTAKPDADTLALAPHALIDVVDPWDSYSAAQFLSDADAQIKRIVANQKIPLLAGGTMLYYKSLWDGLSNLPKSDPAVRKQLAEFADLHGPKSLYEKLMQVDPDSATRIHANDPQRIMRALEVYEIAGVSLSSLQNQKDREHHYDYYNIGLFPQDRKMLHDRIAKRFELMLQAGFEQEVSSLMQNPLMHSGLPSMRCVGYRQMWEHLSGDYDRHQMIDKGVAATRQLAKRQITWLRSMDNCRMHDPFDASAQLLDDTLADWLVTAQQKVGAQGSGAEGSGTQGFVAREPGNGQS